jgi:quinol monooxygenase YgiN
MSLTAIYPIRAKKGKESELLQMLQQGRDFALTVDGCEGFEIFQHKDDPGDLLMTETWSTDDAHQAHFDQNVRGSGVLERAERLMDQPFPTPAGSYYLSR